MAEAGRRRPSCEKPCGAATVRTNLTLPATSRTNALFEAGSETYARLNEIVAVGTGYRTNGGVGHNIFQVL